MEHQKQEFDIQPSMPRTAGRQQNRANPKVTLYNVSLDYLVQEMETRTLGNEDRYCAELLLPSKLADLRDNMLPTRYAAFSRPSSNIRDIQVGNC